MEYLSKKNSKIYKDEFRSLFNNLKEQLGDEWSIEMHLVGSAKRNMVIISNEGFDFDYHIFINKKPKNIDTKDIKSLFMDIIDDIKPNSLSNSKDSTHVITLKHIDENKLIYSYDLAILEKQKGYNYILKNEKENGSNGPYHFVQIPESKSFYSKYKKIKGPEMWNDLREVYFNKKIEQQKLSKDDRAHSFYLLKEATNEILQKYNIE